MLIIVRVCLRHNTQDATEVVASLAANAAHASMIQQSLKFPSRQVLNIKPGSEEKLHDHFQECM
jgi:hypothetical protein